MPEIINWSSKQFFYGDDCLGLVPLRERNPQDLEPLKVVHVLDGYTEGRDTAMRNPVEAERIVQQLVECLDDPRYAKKSFGVVVLQGTGQIKRLEHLINKEIGPEIRAARQIRVGSPPNFQGDERDVIFLSTVVVEAKVTRKHTSFAQACNVAASRAKDQMWLFTSIGSDGFKSGDLRGSLLDYMQDPPSVYGRSPELAEVSLTQRTAPFESMFEQKVFRHIKERGYHVVPQLPVGSRRLDLVVVGNGGRIAVECDGHQWHTSPTDVASDARRDRDLRRMKWKVLRIRESEFELNPERELEPLWLLLDESGIYPRAEAAVVDSSWQPIELTETDDEGADL